MKNILEIIENEIIRDFLKKFLVITISILIFLILLLFIFIFFPSFKSGFLDRNIMISSIATILGGYLGFVGASIGIIGTYGAFYLGINKEKHQKISTSYQVMYYMLNNSVQKTQEMVEGIIEEYHKLTKNKLNKNLCKDIEKDLKYLYSMSFIKYNNREDYEVFESYEEMSFKEYDGYRKFKENVKNKILANNFSALIYDENWYNYITDLPELYVGEITEWINILKFKKDNFYNFLSYRDLMILNISFIYDTKYIRKQISSTLVTKRVHGYKNIYNRTLKEEK
ncbi:hypothetical protein E1H24_20245 (plasmid) [Clostridioides difficile]|uniref:hypothetical protein n=6 Tax=Clostridioides difficile TaxID=1496 RepID=UPI000516D760|nr:hypothetical protein [Clostridioides difficile]EGT3709104.1 hypothetical protein [Clostridioides difficile]EGT4902475.1 hypothetical protein [Clostridioides difficile]EGT5248062.1 hypothetical protein [Clostridioides difficile]EGT5517144.1 hypothetical protein [Clostridioides difficile]MBF9874401.1 hypothetical protein [Clostridioides difficile]